MDQPEPTHDLAPPKLGALVDDYLAAWNEADEDTRGVLLERCWQPAGEYLDPTVHLRGRAALSAHIARVQATRPGAYLELVSKVDHHHSVVRFLWRVVRPGQAPGPVCTDFGEIGTDGLFARMTGFFGAT